MWRHKHVQKIRTQRNVSYPKQNGLVGGGAKIDSPLNLPFSLLTNMLKNRETCCDLCYILFCG